MNICLNCGKEVAQTEGRRARLYCSASCRQKKWQNDQRELRKHITSIIKSGPVVKNKALPVPKSEKSADTKEKKQEVVKEAGNGSESDRGAIEKQIAYVKAEKVPEHRNTSNGRKSWAIDQKKRIQELENQLK